MYILYLFYVYLWICVCLHLLKLDLHIIKRDLCNIYVCFGWRNKTFWVYHFVLWF